MKRWRLLLVAAAVLAVGALLVPGASAKAARGPTRSFFQQGAHRVVFVQTNDLKANHIMVYDRAWDGTLSFVASYAHRRQGWHGSRFGGGSAGLAGFACHRRSGAPAAGRERRQ